MLETTAVGMNLRVSPSDEKQCGGSRTIGLRVAAAAAKPTIAKLMLSPDAFERQRSGQTEKHSPNVCRCGSAPSPSALTALSRIGF